MKIKKSLEIISSVILLFLGTSFASGQNSLTDNSDVRKSLDNMFRNLDKTRIPTGLLLDYAVDIVDFEKFDGKELTDSNIVSLSLLQDILNCVNSASVTGTQPAGDVSKLLDVPSVSNTVGLHLAVFKYNYIKANVLEDGLLLYDEAAEIVSDMYKDGVWQNPYAENFIAAFAPSSEISQSLDVSFNISKSIIRSNVQEDITVLFDAGDGAGYRNVSSLGSISVSYPESGMKELRMRIIVEGKTLELHSQIYVAQKATPMGNTEPDFQIAKSAAYNGETVKGLMSCYYRNHSTLVNPFIVVEGFDPWEYRDLVGEENECELGVHLAATNHLNFFETEFKTSDYDLIYIDWDNSTADIRANAKLLIEFIKEVNAMKEASGCDEPNVLMGQSMGGLVSRYALCKMEDAGEAHQVGTFITHDTPHLGANVPLGALYFVQQALCLVHGYDTAVGLADLFSGGVLSEAERTLYKILYSTSVRQMLVNYVTPSMKIDNTVHNEWQNELDRMGFPETPQNLSIVNGREYTQNYAYGSHYLYMEGYVKTKFWAELIMPVANILTGSILSGLLNGLDLQALRKAVKWWGSNKLRVNAEINPLSVSNTGRTLSEISVKFTKKYLWIVPKTYTLFYDKRTIPSGMLYYDDMPGSKYNLGLDKNTDETESDETPFYQEEDGHNAISKYSYRVGIIRDIMFIPSASALCVGASGRLDGTTSMTDFYVSPPSVSSCPFDAYYLFEEPSQHIEINKDVYNWIKKQSDFKIVGPQRAESGAKYVASGCSGVRWYTSDLTKASISSSGELQVTGSGSVEIVAEKYDEGIMYRARKNVIVDFPDMLIDSEYRAGLGYMATVRTLNISDMEFINELVSSGDLQYEWTYINGEGTLRTIETGSNTYSFIPDEKGVSTICVRLVEGEKKGNLYTLSFDDKSIFKLTHPYVIVNSEGTAIIAGEPYGGPMTEDDVFAIKFNSMPSVGLSDLSERIQEMKENGCYMINVKQRLIKPFALEYDYGSYSVENDWWEFDFFNEASFLSDLKKAKDSTEEQIIGEYHITLFEPSDARRALQTFAFTVLSKPDFMVVKPKPDPDLPIFKPLE